MNNLVHSNPCFSECGYKTQYTTGSVFLINLSIQLSKDLCTFFEKILYVYKFINAQTAVSFLLGENQTFDLQLTAALGENIPFPNPSSASV
jgi:hypothetical protein